MAKIYTDNEVSLDPLKGKRIAVVGYGIQGRAQALNLRDSGLDVIVGARKGSSYDLAKREGFDVFPIGEAVSRADVILYLLPDMVQPEVWGEVERNLRDGSTLDFAHGFTIHYGLIRPKETVDIVMVAPKAPGAAVREEFLRGRGVPALVAVHRDATGEAKARALALAKGIGATRAGVIETTFKEETETDLIGEQLVLVGGLMELITKGWETLVEMGYQPEVAYFEALNEAKLIMDLIWRYGMKGMLERVSVTARYGGLTVGNKVIDEEVKRKMRTYAERVVSGEFTKEWLKFYKEGNIEELMKRIGEHKIEETGRKIREIIFREP
ncbi:ketol-acid reductoisomerase [Candidatus Korarchaeum cryptofilum]|jgi:ketol-acid reductoisomerase|uniref:Ketol-acid reductoisomerase (NADP(+)) n=1 Tax=Korarchaeum cryptofilum (strain OPF8) TaxID=374847 RepID=B1L4L3_KORCO|nr:ketol-acid reductoisomerase [Candidatus Korarchaeum cryptofilum]ACB07392.1 ketol-acid reductoisomerase [Candidatus Korarchaeum cryptofilum OPF8]